jgi:hypothetical protein
MRGPAAPSAQSHKLWLSDTTAGLGLGGVSGGKIRRLGSLGAADFDGFRPAIRAARIMSDKRTLSDTLGRRQARRNRREF